MTMVLGCVRSFVPKAIQMKNRLKLESHVKSESLACLVNPVWIHHGNITPGNKTGPPIAAHNVFVVQVCSVNSYQTDWTDLFFR